MKTSYFFMENNLKSFFRPGWKGMGDPGVEEVETRIFVKPERGCGAVYLPCLRRFYALFLIIIQWNTCFLNTNAVPLRTQLYLRYGTYKRLHPGCFYRIIQKQETTDHT